MDLIGWGSGGAVTVRATPAWVYADQVAHRQQQLEGAYSYQVSPAQQLLVDLVQSMLRAALGRSGVGSKSITPGGLLQRHGRLHRIEYDLRAALAVADSDEGAFERLLGEAFGTVPGSAESGRLRWKHSPDVRTWKKSEAPEVYGAYALSAGLRPPALDAADAADAADEAAEIVAKTLGTVAAEAMALGWTDYWRGIEALADLVAVWRADLLRVIQCRLLPVAYEYADHVPPLASSPCGVIRMASPEVPRGSLRVLQLNPHPLSGVHPSWALAA
ncbi:hypothetical protein ACWGFX_38370 [Streptomyces xanthophaeus]